MQDPKSLDDAFSAAIARVQATQAAQPSPIESIFKTAIARAKAGQPLISSLPRHRQPPKPKLRMSKCVTLSVSAELLDQLNRYCAAERLNPSGAIRYAVYAMMSDPSQLSTMPKTRLKTKYSFEPDRPFVLGSSMSDMQDRHALDILCAELELKLTTFMRRAIYLHTKAYASSNPNEAGEAVADGWGRSKPRRTEHLNDT